MPEVGLEPTWTQGPLDFESSASTDFTTPAKVVYFSTFLGVGIKRKMGNMRGTIAPSMTYAVKIPAAI